MPIKSVKMKISKNKKMRFFLMSQGSLNPKIRFLGQKMCSVARLQTDRHTRKWLLRAPFQGFRSFSFNLSSRIGPTSQEYIFSPPQTLLSLLWLWPTSAWGIVYPCGRTLVAAAFENGWRHKLCHWGHRVIFLVIFESLLLWRHHIKIS